VAKGMWVYRGRRSFGYNARPKIRNPMCSPGLSSMIHSRNIREVLSPLAMLVLLAGAMSAHAAEDEEKEKQPIIQEAEPGTLLLPAGVEEPQAPDKAEKQCMTVCSRWGEECTLINRGIGGTSRKCRRACKQFSEECF